MKTILGWSFALGLALGVVCLTPASNAAQAESSGAPAKVTVTVKNFSFDPKEVTVPAGTTVEWVNMGGKHTIQADNGAFKSPDVVSGNKFEFKFDKPGTYDYYCNYHGSKGGHDMAGKVIVTAAK